MNILDQYVTTKPAPQNAIDIFKGEWSSRLPASTQLTAGEATLFADERIIWAGQLLGGFDGHSIVELGPLEAGHTYMMEQRGAESILAIEANIRAYLKCLIIKEVLNLKRSRFVLGDFIEYLRENDDHYRFCVASGVLYHMLDPVELIQLISKRTDTVLIWTHYYEGEVIKSRDDLSARFSKRINSEHGGFKHTLYKYSYQNATSWQGFCGGRSPFSFWMSKEEILSCLSYFGFKHLRTAFDTLEHPNGPALCIFGEK